MNDIVVAVTVATSLAGVLITATLGVLGWLQGRASATKAAVDAMNTALQAERERREELEGRVETLSDCVQEREELHRENLVLTKQVESLKRQVNRLTKELDHLKKQLFGDGTDSTDTGPMY